MELKKYNEVFKIEDGNPFDAIFNSIDGLKNYSTNDKLLLYAYMFSNYGERYISPAVEFVLTVEQQKKLVVATIGQTFATLCQNKFKHLYDAMFSEYNPIENYSATENYTDTRQLKDNTTDNISKISKDSSVTDTDNDSNSTVNVELKKSGFNTAEPVTDTIQNTTENNTGSSAETVERSGEETHTGQSDKTVTETITHTFQRSGNIGVTTSQQMIESEIKLRENMSFFEILIKEYVDFTTLSIY